LTLSTREVLRGIDGKLHPLPAGFNAAGMGSALRFAREQLRADPRVKFSTTLDCIQRLDPTGAQHTSCLSMFTKACSGVEESAFKWFRTYEELPLLMFELGGLQSKLFAACFLNGTLHVYSQSH
jgi:hypothetical protein